VNWWEADEWAKGKPMSFSDRRADAPMQRLALTTDPEMVRTKQGALRLKLVNRHPHERVRVYVGPRQACRI
jgi:hypothetical protein